ncbi:MAG: DMT family transporter [Candidatus Berkiellales bacterium]
MNAFLYISIIILWGLTWFAIKNQIGIVPIEISLIYRFIIASIVVFFIMVIKRGSFRFSFKQHAAMALLGVLLFSANLIFLYRGSAYLPSGIMAIIFSTSVAMTMLNSIIFLRKSISLNMIIGGLSGLSGLCFIFWPELQGFSLTNETVYGLILALLGAYCFAWANPTSTYCSRLKIPILSSTFYGMIYGMVLLVLFCLFADIPYALDFSTPYLVSLLYLAIPGSVFGFLSYLALVQRIGSEKAVYTTLFFPIVALLVSTYFESFEWGSEAMIGVALIILGNALVITKPTLFSKQLAKSGING